MFELVETDYFSNWIRGLKDRCARSRIFTRLDRLRLGNPGDVRPVGHAVSELRIPYGPGYRVYYLQRNEAVLILLAGGDKSSQRRDIAKALELAEEVRNMPWPE